MFKIESTIIYKKKTYFFFTIIQTFIENVEVAQLSLFLTNTHIKPVSFEFVLYFIWLLSSLLQR